MTGTSIHTLADVDGMKGFSELNLQHFKETETTYSLLQTSWGEQYNTSYCVEGFETLETEEDGGVRMVQWRTPSEQLESPDNCA